MLICDKDHQIVKLLHHIIAFSPHQLIVIQNNQLQDPFPLMIGHMVIVVLGGLGGGAGLGRGGEGLGEGGVTDAGILAE